MKLSLGKIAETACKKYDALQRPEELTRILEIVDKIEPKIILEIGCFKGATLWAWKQICDEVYGITLPVKGLKNHGAHVLMEDSHSDEAVSWIENKLFDRELDMLFIDGDHSYDGVRNDWEMYSPYVRKGGLVIFHDIANWMNQPEVVWFWKDLSKGYVICDAEGSVMSLGFGIVEMGERD